MDAPDRPVATADSAARFEATARLIIEIAAAASGELDLDQILHEALDRLRAVTRLTGGSIALVDGEDLVIRAAIGPFAGEAVGQRLRRGPSRSWGVVERLEPYRTGDLFRDGDRVLRGGRRERRPLVARRADHPPRPSGSACSRSTRPTSTPSARPTRTCSSGSCP